MFGLWSKKKMYGGPAAALYRRMAAQSRLPFFYTQMKIPDSFAGRFDLLALHMCLLIGRMERSETGRTNIALFTQALFDAMFADMEQNLRQIGIGDMGIPKRMKRMMKAFNGRLHAYNAIDFTSLDAEKRLRDVLRRNMYGSLDTPPSDSSLALLSGYGMAFQRALRACPVDRLFNGEMDFPLLENSLPATPNIDEAA